MEQLINGLIITGMLMVVFLGLYFTMQFEPDGDQPEKNAIPDLETLSGQVRQLINESINKDMSELNISQEEAKRREQLRNRLKRAVRTCMNGDFGEKEFLKDYIRDILQKRCGINEFSINEVIAFTQPSKMSAMDQFDILLYLYEKRFRMEGFKKLCKAYGLDLPKENERGVYYQITAKDVREVYRKESPSLRYMDKLNILTDRIYSRFGHGCIDRLRDQQVDGCLGGYSGLPYDVYNYLDEMTTGGAKIEKKYAHDSIHVVLHGITIHMKFMSFGSPQELIRVTRALVRYDAPFEMTRNRPRIVNDMKDGCRVTAVRPPFAETWAFALRRFDSAPAELKDLYREDGQEMLCIYIRYLVRGGAHIAVCGPQNSGKTTLMKALLYHINQSYHLRVGESVFELWMRKLLPEQNILTIRDTDSVGLKEGLELLRKTDGNCLMLGEVAELEIAALAVELSKVSEQQILTNHSTSEDELIAYFKEAQMRTGTFSDERMAEEAVAKAFQIDIQTARNVETGHRYIKSVSQIIVRDWEDKSYDGTLRENLNLFFERMTKQRMYTVRKLVEYREGRYIFQNEPDYRLLEKLKNHLSEKDSVAFTDFLSMECNQNTVQEGVGA